MSQHKIELALTIEPHVEAKDLEPFEKVALLMSVCRMVTADPAEGAYAALATASMILQQTAKEPMRAIPADVLANAWTTAREMLQAGFDTGIESDTTETIQ